MWSDPGITGALADPKLLSIHYCIAFYRHQESHLLYHSQARDNFFNPNGNSQMPIVLIGNFVTVTMFAPDNLAAVWMHTTPPGEARGLFWNLITFK